MIRTQIQLTEEQARQLKAISISSQESVAALIRKAIDRFLATGNPDRVAQYRQAFSIAGKYEADSADISVDHDRFLEEAYR